VVQTLHQITQAATPQGECVYQAPEVLAGTRALTPACDVYSLAACLYQALTLQPPFNPQQPLTALYKQIQERLVENPRDFNPAVPKPLADLLLSALGKDPNNRPKSPDAFRLGLLELISSAPPRTAKLGSP
jgi:serine/threonine protein kinase